MNDFDFTLKVIIGVCLMMMLFCAWSMWSIAPLVQMLRHHRAGRSIWDSAHYDRFLIRLFNESQCVAGEDARDAFMREGTEWLAVTITYSYHRDLWPMLFERVDITASIRSHAVVTVCHPVHLTA